MIAAHRNLLNCRTLRSPDSLRPNRDNTLYYTETELVEHGHCTITRYLDPPLVDQSRLHDLAAMRFYMVGTISQENFKFESETREDGSTRNTVSFDLEHRRSLGARIDWDRQVKALSRIIRRARGVVQGWQGMRVKDLMLLRRVGQGNEQKVNVHFLDVEERTAQQGPGYTMRDEDGQAFDVSGPEPLMGRAISIIFQVDCIQMPEVGPGWYAFASIDHLQYF